jgi:2-(1,2-epoxy-1,2-dihydrophenyl)acetyl-CoA isomerase
MTGTATEPVTETRVLTDRPEPDVLRITLDGPRRRNAIGRDAFRDLEGAVRLAWEDDVRAVVVTGAAGYFCSGADLRSSVTPGPGVGGGAKVLTTAHRWLDDLRRAPKPVVAAVEGGAVGIGWSLALACDLTVAAEDAYFLSPFLERGLVPDGGCAWFLTQALGQRRAAELLMLSKRLPATRAEQLGLVNRLVAPGTAEQEALALAVRLASGPPDALMLTKRLLLSAGESAGYRELLDQEWLAVALDLHSPDRAEGRAAFLERRAPDFSKQLPSTD